MIPKYTINLLAGISRWLHAKSGSVWAKSFGHASTMQQWSTSLDQVLDYLKANNVQCTRCGGTDGPLLREVNGLDCQCCTRYYTVDFATGQNHHLHVTRKSQVKFVPAPSDFPHILNVTVTVPIDFESLNFMDLAEPMLPLCGPLPVLKPGTMNMLRFVSQGSQWLFSGAVTDLK